MTEVYDKQSECAKVTYKIKPKTVYVLSKMIEDGKCFSVSKICETDSPVEAERVMHALKMMDQN